MHPVQGRDAGLHRTASKRAVPQWGGDISATAAAQLRRRVQIVLLGLMWHLQAVIHVCTLPCFDFAGQDAGPRHSYTLAFEWLTGIWEPSDQIPFWWQAECVCLLLNCPDSMS